MKKLFFLCMVLAVAVVAAAKFVIVKTDGTLVVVDDDRVTVAVENGVLTLNGVSAAEIGSVYNKEWDAFDDYARAFSQGYVATDYLSKPRGEQITSQAFKALLKPLVEQFQPDSLAYFNENITDYDMPITRGMACCMAYYTARCIGAETGNRSHGPGQPDDLWSNWDGNEYAKLLPHCNDEGEDDYPEDKFWRSRTFGNVQTPRMWNLSHWSEYSHVEVVGMDVEAFSYRWNDAMTWGEAVEAVTRLYDSFEPDITYADISDERVTTPDASVITPELLARAAQSEVRSIGDLPRLYGFDTSAGGSGHSLYSVFTLHPSTYGEMAEWGFNSVKFQCSYLLLFDREARQANLTFLRRLDALVAAAMEYGLHMTIKLNDVPGRIQYATEDDYADYELDFDILDATKRQQCRTVLQSLARRYKDVPNRNLSFETPQMGMSVWDAGIYGQGKTFPNADIIEWVDFLIDSFREVSPGRFIFYECVSDRSLTFDMSKDEDKTVGLQDHYRHVSQKYDNTRIVIGHMDMAYGFATYQANRENDVVGGNIDFAMHSSEVPTYPATLYGLNETLTDTDNQLTIDGTLPQGTQLDFYVASASAGTLTFKADGTTLHTETFTADQQYNRGYMLNYACPFATSDKRITLTLPADAQTVTVTANGGWYTWAGISVTLPSAYAVNRWRWDSLWDVALGILAPEDYHNEFYRQQTSTVLIGPAGNNTGGDHITIHDDVRFTSGNVVTSSSAATYDRMCRNVTAAYPQWAGWIEDINCTDNESLLRFFDDTMSAYQRCGADFWISCDNLYAEYGAPYRVAGYQGVAFQGHYNFNLPLLRVLQKYQ